MDENENKEELEKKEEKVEETVEENTTEEVKEVPQDSEKYYDEIDYQKKEEVEEVKAKTRGVLREVLDWVVCFVLAYLMYICLNYFIFSSPSVKQDSMYPTIMNGERVFILRPLVSGDLNYGDIVTFEAPIDNKYYLDTEGTFPTAQYENYTGITAFLYEVFDYQKVNYVKRVIGLPGDTIEIKEGKVYRNGEALEENYIRTSETTPQVEDYSNVTVPEGTVYVMGDNRAQSKDSRTFGCIPMDRVNGKVMFRVWPFSKFGAIDKE